MKKIEAPITLVAVIESAQHEALRRLAFAERRSLADVVREAIDKLIDEREAHGVRRVHAAAAAKAGRAKERHAAARAK
jgi:hypothetical protein